MSKEAGSSSLKFVFDFWPTGLCDMECPFCYGAVVPQIVSSSKVKLYKPSVETVSITGDSDPRPEMSFNQVCDVLKKLCNSGGKAITIAGGEPLLRPETPDIINFAKNELGMVIYLSTDGTYVIRNYNRFSRNIDVLGLPLDGSSIDMNVKMGRRSYLLKNVTSIFEQFKMFPPDHKVKVGTVVSRKNIGNIVEIGRFLFNNSSIKAPDVWRLYQFESIGRGLQYEDDYVVSDDEFEKICSELEGEFPNVDLRPRTNQDHNNAYFFVTPDGMLQIVEKNEHISIADLLRLNEKQISVTISNRIETIERANKNRDWLVSDAVK